MAGKKKPGPKVITAEHREAISAARAQNAAVNAYLEALAAPRVRRTLRKPETIRVQLEDVRAAIDEEQRAGARLGLVQQRLDLEAELAVAEAWSASDVGALADAERDFVEHVAAYSARRGITWDAWREVGVPVKVLRAAGLSR